MMGESIKNSSTAIDNKNMKKKASIYVCEFE